MIRTHVDDSEVQNMLGAIEGMAATIKTAQYTGPMLKHIHTTLAREFDMVADVVAMSSPTNFHHVYEWKMAGIPQARLWRHTLSGGGNNRIAGFQWKASKTPIPTPKERATNSNDPMSRLSAEDIAKLSDRRYFFYWKAPVMEYNMTVHIAGRYSPKKLLMIPTWTDQKVGKEMKPFVFVPAATMKVPGGERTTGRFSGLWASWWATQAPQVFKREIANEIGRDIKQSVEGVIRKRSKSVSISASSGSFAQGKRDAQAALMRNARRYDRNMNEDDSE